MWVLYAFGSALFAGITAILVTFVYDLVRNLRLYGAAGAFSVIIFFVVLITFLITNRITRATESYSES